MDLAFEKTIREVWAHKLVLWHFCFEISCCVRYQRRFLRVRDKGSYLAAGGLDMRGQIRPQITRMPSLCILRDFLAVIGKKIERDHPANSLERFDVHSSSIG